VTTDELYLLVAETRCEHGHLTLEDAERAATGDDWTAYLRDAAHPGPYAVRDFHAYQTHAPHLPADWIVLRTRADRLGHDYGPDRGTLTLPDLALLLADADADASDPADSVDSAAPAWQLHAIHHTGPMPSDADGHVAYLIEVVDPATAEVRPALSLAAYRHLRAATPAACEPTAAPPSTPARPPTPAPTRVSPERRGA